MCNYFVYYTETYENDAQMLMDEFSKGTIDIIVSDFSSVDGQSGIFSFHFSILFNKDFESPGSNVPTVNEDYQKYIDKQRLFFYDEINENVLSGKDPSMTLNTIQDYKLRFQEIQSFYQKTIVERFRKEEVLINHNRYTRHKNHELRAIAVDDERRISSTYFKVQLEAVEMIIEFLDLKLGFLRETERRDSIASQNSNSAPNMKVPCFFTLVRGSGVLYETKIPTFYLKLAKDGFIPADTGTEKNFLLLFSKKGIETPIIWYKANGLLHYLIDRLSDEKIIQKKGELIDWKIVQNSFYMKKKGVKYKLSSLSGAHSHETIKLLRDKIDEIIDFLLSST